MGVRRLVSHEICANATGGLWPILRRPACIHLILTADRFDVEARFHPVAGAHCRLVPEHDMADFTRPTPRQPVPPLTATLAGGGRFDLSAENPKTFSLVVFYRGLHCPICRRYLTDLDSKVEEFEMRGVSVVAVSTDNAERAERTRSEWDLKHLRIAYGLSLRMARAWGLYISTSRGKTAEGFEEPALFPEPGIFLIRPDRTLYYCSVQTLPFSRPHFDDILAAIDYVVERNYPARGEA